MKLNLELRLHQDGPQTNIKPQDLLIDIHVLVVTFHIFIGIVCLTTKRLHLTVPSRGTIAGAVKTGASKSWKGKTCQLPINRHHQAIEATIQNGTKGETSSRKKEKECFKGSVLYCSAAVQCYVQCVYHRLFIGSTVVVLKQHHDLETFKANPMLNEQQRHDAPSRVPICPMDHQNRP